MGGAGQGRVGRRGGRRRLSRSADFDRVFREGRSYATRHLVLHVFPRASAERREEGDGARPAHGSGREDHRPRLGVSVGRRVGGAVERNRVKRLLREAFWALAPELPDDLDFVLVARPEAAELARREGEAGFEDALREVVDRSGLAASPDPRP